MKIDSALLQNIAQLAQLEINTQHETALLEDMTKILTWIEKLKELDTTGIRPLVTVASETNILEDDIPQVPLTHEEAVANAPDKDANYFGVPQVKE